MTGWEDPQWSVWFAAGYLSLLTLWWALLALGAGRWGARWTLPREDGEDLAMDGEFLTICVPARDEAGNIGRCVRAALATRWAGAQGEGGGLPTLEVIVVDDRSTDGTGAVALEAGGGDARLRVIDGTEPPAGWAGKAWACARAAGEARGDWLLFGGADVELDPGAALALARAADRDRLDLVSAFGTWELVGFWERALIPAVGWFIRGAVDLDRVNDPGLPEAFANGQLILTRRGAYEAVGGHAEIRAQVLDDVRLAEAFKRRGFAVGMRVAPWAFRVRLYRSLGEIMRGYAKNLYEGMGRRPMLGLGAVLFIAIGTLLPLAAFSAVLVGRLALGWQFPGAGWIAWLGLISALQLALRVRLEWRDGRSGAIAWAHLPAQLLLVWILLRSVFGVRVAWKGRTFVDGRAS